VVSAKVEERVENRAAVRITVDVEYSESLSKLVKEVSKNARDNIAQQKLPDIKATQVKVTVGRIHRLMGNGLDRMGGAWAGRLDFLNKELRPWLVPLLVLEERWTERPFWRRRRVP
jgi:hypothetical protein